MHYDICVVGGAGHVGLPLAISFAEKGQKVLVYDINKSALDTIAKGQMPFMERGAESILRDVLERKLLSFSSKPEDIHVAKNVIITIGTPVDEFLNPSLNLLKDCFRTLQDHLHHEQLLILRSTVYPGVTEWLGEFLDKKDIKCQISFCPERIVQGYAMEELKTLPQIVSGLTPEAENRAAELFLKIAPEVVRVTPKEAEFAKLFANSFRYIHFAVANQFYMICESANVDYYRVQHAVKHNYPRSADLPSAGFAAGPCLFKDTMQLSAFYENQYSIGLNAMLVNEGMPLFIVSQLRKQFQLNKKRVGLLGMAFKSESDDRRSSLSYKLKKVLALEAQEVLTTDPFVNDDPEIRPLDEVLAKSDILILCAPHKAYKNIEVKGREVIDIWNFWPKETTL
ncbi:MAG: nucleotide sugar dehydrogenase [Pseudobdellovibrionaceae bacterium]